MTTESRMREALKESAWAIQELLALIHGECPRILDSDRGGSWAQVERIDKALASAMEALSPPTRRTSAAEAEVERLRELLGGNGLSNIRLALETMKSHFEPNCQGDIRYPMVWDLCQRALADLRAIAAIGGEG